MGIVSSQEMARKLELAWRSDRFLTIEDSSGG